tara:strand:+ start:1527 stop:2831 length:1305 start_codon:yes stop_codon:yes gene_type:complete
MFGLFGGNKNKKAFEAKNQATLDERKTNPFERQAMDKQILDSIKNRRGIDTLTSKDIQRDYGDAKKSLEKALVRYGRGARSDMPTGAFGDSTRDFTPSDFDKEGDLMFFTANPPTLPELFGDMGRAMPNFGIGAGVMSLIDNIGKKFNLNDSFKKLLNIKNEEQQTPLESLQNALTQREKELFGSMNPSMNPVTAPVVPIAKEGLESIMPTKAQDVIDFSNFVAQDPTGMAEVESDVNRGATDPTGMGMSEGTLYDPTRIGGMQLFPNTPPPGTEVSETDYEGRQGVLPNTPPPGFEPSLNSTSVFEDTPATYYDSSPISTLALNSGQNAPQGAFPGGFKLKNQEPNKPYFDQEGALVFAPDQVDRLGYYGPGFAYGGDVNRAVMNGQNGMSASDEIDNRIMKNLEFQNKYNMGGRAMSTYDKLKMIANSIAEG